MADRSLSPLRKFVYGLLVASIILLAAVSGTELALHLAGVGHSPHFARRTTAPDGTPIWRENRWVTAPYFGEHRVRQPWPFRLPVTKATGSYRVFVLGSSAAMGDPEPSFSLARQLDAMLTAAYPEIHFEVVNAAITAINSHVLRGIAADCADLSPDLFIVYEGHNEVIGPFGPAGVFSSFQRSPVAVRTADFVQRSRLGQWLRARLQPDASDAEWGGMQMFLDQQIAATDPRLDAVRSHFAANLRAITGAGNRAGATTLLCTVLTNERDFAPFLSQHRTDLSAADQATWQSHYLAGDTALAAGDPGAAERAYRAALAIDDQYAELVFRLGRVVLQRGDRAAAATLLQRALDLDTLRFRTDSDLNAVVREVAAAADQRQVQLVDLERELAPTALAGIPGDDLLYEHVHLNFHGTYLVARTLFARIGADLVERGRASRFVGEPLSEAAARERLGYNVHEQTMIALELERRFAQPPFNAQSDNAQRQYAWSERAHRGATLLENPAALPALRAGAEHALQAAPNDWVLLRNSGAMLVARGDAAAGLPWLEQAAAWIGDDVDTLMALAKGQQELGQTAAAAATFAKVRALEPNYPGLPAPGE